MSKVWGILGGMGPLASAEFMRTIHHCGTAERDQDFPRIFLVSFPNFPDRTESILSSRGLALAEEIDGMLRKMLDFGATDLVVCCYTAHFTLPWLSPGVRESLFSLPQFAVSSIVDRRKKTLVLCTKGLATSGLFQSQAAWPKASEYAVFPNGKDTEAVHSIIYDLKKGMHPDLAIDRLEGVCMKYGCGQWLLGCTELHLLSAHKPDHPELHAVDFLDPLFELATSISGEIECAA